jgi:hypothetical protein
MSKVTVVSGLFYLARDKWKHSAFPQDHDRYKSWVKNLLSLDTHLYFYVDDFYYDYVLEHRLPYDPNLEKTVIVKTSLSQTHFFKNYYVDEACLMNSPEFKKRVFFHQSADMNYSLYHIVNFAKIEFVKNTYEKNKFNSDYFFWVDAGGLREDISRYANVKWPDESSQFLTDKLVHFSHHESFDINQKQEYFLSQLRNIQGTAWIVPKDKVIPFFNKVEEQVKTILREEIVGSDEKVYDFLYLQDPDFYQLIKCGWFEFFNKINRCKQPEIFITNAYGTEEVNVKLGLITVTWNYENTYDITNTSLYKSFKRLNPNISIIQFHHDRRNHQELERQFSAKFGVESELLLYKIQFLLDNIKTIKHEYVFICDAADVTCMRPVDYLLEMFDLETQIVIGHEKNMWPMQSVRNNWPKYTDYDDEHKIAKTFLNSGMIFGKVDNIIKMLETIIDKVFTTNIDTFNNDQGVYTYYYNMGLTPKIILDTSNIFALNTYLRTVDEAYLTPDNKFVYKKTGVIPAFVHDNGWNHGSPRYHNHFQFKNLYE